MENIINKNNNDYSWPGVIEFLVKQYKGQQMKENEFLLEISCLKDENNSLDQKVKAWEKLNLDLLEKVKMLEYGLLKERIKFFHLISNSNLKEKNEMMSELVGKHESNKLISDDIENFIFNKLKENENKVKEHQDFVKKLINDIDCKDLLEDYENSYEKYNNTKNYDTNSIDLDSKNNYKNNFKYDSFSNFKVNKIDTEELKKDIKIINPSSELKTHLDSIRKIKIYKNQLVSLGEDALIRVQNLNNNKNKSTIRVNLGYFFSLDVYNDLILSGAALGELFILSLKDNEIIHKFEAHDENIWDIKHNNSTNLFCTIGADNFIKFWTYKLKENNFKFKNNPEFSFKEKYQPSSIKWNEIQNYHWYSTFMNSNNLNIYDITIQKVNNVIDLNSNGNCIDNLNDKILVGCDDGIIRLVDPLSSESNIIKIFDDDKKYINTIKLIPNTNNNYFLTGGEGDQVKLWDLRKKSVIKILSFQETKNNESAISIDFDESNKVYIGGMNGTINTYEYSQLII